MAQYRHSLGTISLRGQDKTGMNKLISYRNVKGVKGAKSWITSY